MNIHSEVIDFLRAHRQAAGNIDSASALTALQAEIKSGLSGCAVLPMLPSYIGIPDRYAAEGECIAVDIGGSTLCTAHAVSCSDGSIVLRDVRSFSVPGLISPITEENFFGQIVRLCGISGDIPVAVNYSYNMRSVPDPDAEMLGWCKELKITDMTGATIAQAIKRSVGSDNFKVSVVNDSAVALLGCVQQAQRGSGIVGIIVGTGFNICAPFPIGIDGRDMLVNTEVGKSDAFSKGDFDAAVLTASADALCSHAEKQCSGRYLERIILTALDAAAREGLISDTPAYSGLTLRELVQLTEHIFTQDDAVAAELVLKAAHRSAKIAAIYTWVFLSQVMRRYDHVYIAAEGFVILRLPHYRKFFEEELRNLSHGSPVPTILSAENVCLTGAALAHLTA